MQIKRLFARSIRRENSMQIKLFWGDEMEDNANHFLMHIPSNQVHDVKLASTQFGRTVMVIYEED